MKRACYSAAALTITFSCLLVTTTLIASSIRSRAQRGRQIGKRKCVGADIRCAETLFRHQRYGAACGAATFAANSRCLRGGGRPRSVRLRIMRSISIWPSCASRPSRSSRLRSTSTAGFRARGLVPFHPSDPDRYLRGPAPVFRAGWKAFSRRGVACRNGQLRAVSRNHR